MNGERIPGDVGEFDELDEGYQASLRPGALAEYVGQEEVKANLAVFLEAARRRGSTLDHVLLSGPPGLGKTTLAHIIAAELSVPLRSTSGPAIQHSGELAGLLTNLQEREVLFIDEIHRLAPAVEEALYPAMEDYEMDVLIDKGPAARTIKINLSRFTLVGATTRTGLLTKPLRDRFGIKMNLDFYRPDELRRILVRSARIMDVPLDAEGADEVARRSRGTPRIANFLLRRLADFALVETDDGRIDRRLADSSLKRMNIDHRGLDTLDRRYLDALCAKFSGGPVGVETLAASLAEEKGTLEDVVEPYLLRQGFIQRTPRGRTATPSAWEHLGLDSVGGGSGGQGSLF